jgi:DNA polymerase IIIc chi subunit
LVDRVLDDLLRDDLRVSKDGSSGGQKDGLDESLWSYRDEFHQEVDEVFAAL